MKIGNIPTLRAVSTSFAVLLTAGDIMSRFLPMRSNNPFGEQKSCCTSIIKSAVWDGSTTSSIAENTSLPNAVIIFLTSSFGSLGRDFAVKAVAHFFQFLGSELPIKRHQILRRCDTGQWRHLEICRR